MVGSCSQPIKANTDYFARNSRFSISNQRHPNQLKIKNIYFIYLAPCVSLFIECDFWVDPGFFPRSKSPGSTQKSHSMNKDTRSKINKVFLYFLFSTDWGACDPIRTAATKRWRLMISTHVRRPCELRICSSWRTELEIFNIQSDDNLQLISTRVRRPCELQICSSRKLMY